jgi:hypothetical protein
MQFRKEASWEPVFDSDKLDDGVAAHVVRLGAGMAAMGPDPKIAGGYYVFVANGSLAMDGEELPVWSMVAVESNEDAFEMRAGTHGLEALVLQYPREDE